MTSIASRLSELVKPIFVEMGVDEELGSVRASDRPDLAPFQCNGAMSAAKLLKQNPRQIAGDIASKLEKNKVFSKVEVAGPGFINLHVTDRYLADYLNEMSNDKHYLIPQIGKDQIAVLDYGGPNIAKAMHVGHFRPAVIGDALRQIMISMGFKALGDVHLGDWGTPMGMIICALQDEHPDWPYFDEEFQDNYPETSPVTIQDLERIYPLAAQKAKDDEAYRERARKATLELQQGRAGYRALWQHFFDVSIASLKDNYTLLGVHFDLWKGESDSHIYIAPMVEDLYARGIAKDSDGAVVIDVAEDGDTRNVPPLILYKSDGAVLYGTTDCATIVERVKHYNPNRIIYVVDQRQNLHFEQVFRASYKGGLVENSVDLVHAGFGTMNGPDGKPFKTRDGGLLRLKDFITMAEDRAMERLNEAELASTMNPKEREEVSHIVALAAIKFADLINPRQSDYIFNIDKMVSFEGKTGPYILYQAVRIKSLLSKANENGLTIASSIAINNSSRPLAILLGELPSALETSLNSYAPHYLADFVYRLAQEFSRFYNSCHILNEKNRELQESYLSLCKVTYEIIEFVCKILGVELLDRM